jgi:hypothetical protein
MTPQRSTEAIGKAPNTKVEGDRRIARAQKIAMQRMAEAIILNCSERREERLGYHLAAINALAEGMRGSSAKRVRADSFNLKYHANIAGDIGPVAAHSDASIMVRPSMLA